MPCPPVYDFIGGTRIVLPRPGLDQRTENKIWDILRPNERASELVARHLAVLVQHASADED